MYSKYVDRDRHVTATFHLLCLVLQSCTVWAWLLPVYFLQFAADVVFFDAIWWRDMLASFRWTRRWKTLRTTRRDLLLATHWHHRELWHTHIHTVHLSDTNIQALLPLCLDRVWARMGVGHLLLPAQLPQTHWAMICVIRHLALAVSDVCIKPDCFQSTSTYIKGITVYALINSWL